MVSRLLFLAALLVLLTSSSLAQDIYKWKGEKGQWHFSDTPPPGVTAEKVRGLDLSPKSSPATSPYAKPSESPAAGSRSKEEAVSKLPGAPPSDVSRKDLMDRWLLLRPPYTQAGIDDSRPFSEWIPWQSFDSAEVCEIEKAIVIANSIQRRSRTETEIDLQAGMSRCISSVEFKPSKEANVIVVLTQVGRDPKGSSATRVFSGRVFNRGQATARNVVVKYQLRRFGVAVGKGKIRPVPSDIPGMTSSEYRGQFTIRGGRVTGHTEVDWSN